MSRGCGSVRRPGCTRGGCDARNRETRRDRRTSRGRKAEGCNSTARGRRGGSAHRSSRPRRGSKAGQLQEWSCGNPELWCVWLQRCSKVSWRTRRVGMPRWWVRADRIEECCRVAFRLLRKPQRRYRCCSYRITQGVGRLLVCAIGMRTPLASPVVTRLSTKRTSNSAALSAAL